MIAGTPIPPVPAPESPLAGTTGMASRVRLAAAVLYAIAAAIALAVLAGWMLTGRAPAGGTMTVNTAIVLLVTSAAVALFHRRDAWDEPPRALLICVGVAAVLSCTPMIEALTGWRFGVDAVFAATAPDATTASGSAALSGAIASLLLQGAIVLGLHPARYGAAQTFVFGAAILAAVDGTALLLDSSPATIGLYGAMSGATALGFLLLSFALVLSRPNLGVVRATLDPGLGGLIARRTLPVALVVPAFVAGIAWLGVGRGLYTPAFAGALAATLAAAAMGATILLVARLLRGVEHERHEAEIRRLETEHHWRRAVTDAPVPMVVHDGDQILEMNHAWTGIAGLDTMTAPSISAWVAQAWPSFVAELPAFRARLTSATDTVQDGEQTIRGSEGEERVWAFSSTPIGSAGSPARRLYVTTAVDVTARRQSEATLQRLNDDLEERIAERTSALTRANDALKRQAGQLREQTLLLDLVRDGILVRDLYGTIIYWNHGATSMYGWTREQALGRVSHQLLGAEYPMPIPDIEKQVMRAGFWEGDAVHVTQAGHRLHVESHWTLTRTERGVPEGFLEVHRDISQRRKSERALQAKADALARSNHELEQFAYVASHDLQEPLRMVSNYTQLLARRYRDRLDSDANEFIDFAVDGAKRMQDLIHDLLQYARVERAGREFRPVPADRIVADALANLAGAIDESRASIVVEALPTLTCDASQMTQVFQNLIGNAIKFRQADRAPVVRVSATREDGAWRLSVADNGIGIEPRFFDRIFQMFQRLHGRGEYSGTGIGLALCKKIVERHGGHIGVASEVGRGTTFSLTIPDTASI